MQSLSGNSLYIAIGAVWQDHVLTYFRALSGIFPPYMYLFSFQGIHRCRICYRTFKRRKYMLDHVQNIHEQKRRWMCGVCGQGFFSKSDFKIHSDGHLDKRDFLCRTCGKGFLTNSSRNRHEAEASCEKANLPKEYACMYCAKFFSCERYVVQHLAFCKKVPDDMKSMFKKPGQQE